MPTFLARLRKIIIHPVVFATFPTVALYARNAFQGGLREAAIALIGVLAGVALLWLAISLVARDSYKAAILVSAFFLLFFAYGPARISLKVMLGRAQLYDQAGIQDQADERQVSAMHAAVFRG